MNNWKLKLGNFLFEHRSFTPVPLIILVVVLFRPVDLGEMNPLVNSIGIVISILGELIRIMAVGYSFAGTSGRESYLRADNLNSTGIYSIVRNPLYIGNFFIFSGLVVVFSNVWAILVFAFFLILQYYFVVLAEENYLKGEYSKDYEDYCNRVRRIIPVIGKYRKNQNPFNLRKVIFKENDSVFNLLVIYLLVLLYKERVFSGAIINSTLYSICGGILVAAYILVKIIKKKAK
ncbi:MAG: hypothetical protein GY757_51665 [bacterium]|nr:hypothetical protein [bacterium]